jgi:uncharacterized protein (DUF1697 family)
MVPVISMLRGVNVGGHNKIKMETLREAYESLGLRDVQTYVQSGNVVFTTNERNLAALGRRIEETLERKFGFRPGVVLRTAQEMQDVIERNPFAGRQEIEPAKLQVTFLGANPGAEMRDAVLQIKPDPEELLLDGRELYIYFPNGMGRSKLVAVLDKALKKSGTTRNWNTVTKLLELAEKPKTK